MAKSQINLINSINTDTVSEDIKLFTDAAAPLLINTGIERDGGITNLYRTETDFVAGTDNFYTESGDLITISNGTVEDTRNVAINNQEIGMISSYGVDKKAFVSNVDDVVLTDTNTYITLKLIGTNVNISEYSIDNVLLYTRTTNFTGITNLASFVTLISFVRYNGIQYTDSLEFSLRVGDNLFIIRENDPTKVFSTGSTQTNSVLGTNDIFSTIIYAGNLIIAGEGGRVGSFDGTNWKNYDGSGVGTGISNNSIVLGTNDILTMAIYGSVLVFGGVGGRLGSYDGSAWKNYDGSGLGSGPSNNATVIGNSNIRTISIYNTTNLVVAGDVGRVGSFNGTTWTNYNSGGTGVSVLANNGTVIGAENIYTSQVIDNQVVYIGGAGRIGSSTESFFSQFPLAANRSNVFARTIYRTKTNTVLLSTIASPGGLYRSPNGGNSFSPTPVLLTPFYSPTIDQVSTDGNGNWVAIIYPDNDEGNDLKIKYSNDDAITWNDATLTNFYLYKAQDVREEMSVVYSGTNFIISGQGPNVADDPRYTTISTSTNGSTWSDGVIVENTLDLQLDHHSYITTDGAGAAYIYYTRDFYPAFYCFIKSTDNGATWSGLTNIVSASLTNCISKKLYSFPGNILIALIVTSTQEHDILRSSDAGTNWAAPYTLADSGDYVVGRLSISYDGSSIIAYGEPIDNPNLGRLYYYQSLDLGATWGSRQTINLSTYQYFSSNVTWIGASSVRVPAVIVRKIDGNYCLSVGSSAALGASWTNYDGSGTMIHHADALGGNDIFCSLLYGDGFVLAGEGGRVSSYDGTNYKLYDASGTGTGPYSSTCNGVSDIRSLTIFNTALVLAGAAGRISSYNGTVWTLYDGTGGAGVYSNGTIVGNNTIYSILQYNNQLTVATVNSVVGTINSDGSENSFYSDGSILYTTLLGGFDSLAYVYCYRYEGDNDHYLINLVGNDNNRSYVLTDSTKVISILKAKYAIPQVSNGLTRHILTGDLTSDSAKEVITFTITAGASSAGDIVVRLRDVDNTISLALTDTTDALVATKIAAGTYTGWTAAAVLNVVTFTATSVGVKTGTNTYTAGTTGSAATVDVVTAGANSSNLFGTGLVGWTDFNNFSSATVYPSTNITTVSNISTEGISGFGYLDSQYQLSSSATDLYEYYSPQFIPNPTSLYGIYQSNTPTNINAYGKLNNQVGSPTSLPFEFRVGYVNGIQTYLSVAVVIPEINKDYLGTIITNVGEFDPSYTPMIMGDHQILYKYNNIWNIVDITETITDPIQKIDNNLYKINTISPMNVLKVDSKTLEMSSIDYNGRMFFTSTATPDTTQHFVVSKIDGSVSNSIDAGSKGLYIPLPITSDNYEVIGFTTPYASYSSYTVDVYLPVLDPDTSIYNTEYYKSTLNNGNEMIIPNKVGLLYVEDTRLPIGIGSIYNSGVISSNNTTIFLNPDYDGYTIGNQTTGLYTPFSLSNGYTYLFDGIMIYVVSMTTSTSNDVSYSVFNGKTKLASASGMKFIAVSPTEAYFLSPFDNSLYTFSGGQTVDKVRRLNKLPIVSKGVYNTVENTLVLDSASTIIFLRDSIISQIDKNTDQLVGIDLYSTADGVYIASGETAYLYSYYTGTYVEPLTIQTSYFGQENNQRSKAVRIVATIYNPLRTRTTLDGVYYSFDQEQYKTENIRWIVNPIDFSDTGYARVRLQPKNQLCLGASIKISTNQKIILTDLTYEYEDDVDAKIKSSMSR